MREVKSKDMPMPIEKLILGLTTTLLSSAAFAAPPAWEITDEDSRIVLFPTIHVLPEGLDWETNQLALEIETADEVWLEIADADSPEAQAEIQALMAAHGTSPDIPLSSRLSDEQLTTLKKQLAVMGIPLESVDPLRPWMAALMLTLTNFSQSGISPESGVEKVLNDYFGERPVRGLESAAFQVSIFSSMSDEDQVDFLMSSLEEMDGVVDMFQAISESWARGETDAIEQQLISEMETDFPHLFEALFTNRNANWADIIETEMAGSGTDFIAVGAGHLIGDKSVQSMLVARGYTIKRIDLTDK